MLLRSLLLLLFSLGLAHGFAFMPPLAQFQDLDLDNLDLDVHKDHVDVPEESGPVGIGESAPIVTVPGLGTARGKVLKTYGGRDMYTYHSMPFALPPVGKLRFQYSVLWDNTTGAWPTEEGEDSYDATYMRAKCPQPSVIIPHQIVGREDCLHLSVYAPQNPSEMKDKKLPVMYWIYGGAYMIGDESFYEPTKIMDHDVVVVVMQYRLGVLGFMAALTADNPGNMGLSDQVTGLRWVQQHISYFGGDPDSVTVFGQSAGGASANWMQITPLTHGPANNGRQLIHRVIAQSGSALEKWTLDLDPETSFQDTAKIMDCTQQTKEKQLKCMRKLPYETIIKAGLTIYAENRREGGLGFKGLCPVIQTPLVNQTDVEVLIPKNPIQILEDGEYLMVPTMGGAVRDEGLLVAGWMWTDFIEPNNYTNDTDFFRNEALSYLLHAFGYEDETGGLSTTVQLAYMPEDVEMGNWTSMVGGIIDMTGVLFLKSGIWQVAHKMYMTNESVPFYFYSFEFESDDSIFWFIFGKQPDLPVPGGICHTDDLLYLFPLPINFDERELLTSHRMTTLWTNFAKYGNPTPEETNNWKNLDVEKWKPFNFDELNFMLISDNFTIHHDFTTRWNYHKHPASSYDPTATTTTQSPDVTNNTVSIEVYNEVLTQKQSLQVATEVVGVLLGCSLLVAGFLGHKLRRISTV